MIAEFHQALTVAPEQWPQVKRTQGLLKHAAVLPVGTLAGSCAVVTALWPVTSSGLLATWFNSALVLVLGHWVAAYFLGRVRGSLLNDTRIRRRWLIASSLITGIFWGASALILMPAESPLHQLLLAFIVAAVAAFWLPIFALERATLFTLAAPALLPMAFALLLSPPVSPQATMGSLVFLLFGALAIAAHILKTILDADCATERALFHQATHDALVGLANHAEFDHRVAAFDAAPTGPHAIVFIDLDNFKAINDSAGHGTGDEVLRQVGAVLRTEKRKIDVAARVGGDEFALLMEKCSDLEALRVADAILMRISELSIVADEWDVTVTASIGVACSGETNVGTRSVLEAADRACYAAKTAGRNRVALAGSGPPGRSPATGVPRIRTLESRSCDEETRDLVVGSDVG